MSLRPPQAERVFVEGSAGPLEALVEVPADAAPGVVAVCCHPHPLFGGTMQNLSLIHI